MISDGKIVKVGNGTVSAKQLLDTVVEMIKEKHHLIDVENELAAMIAWLPAIIGRLDMNYRYLFIGPQIEELSGKPPQFYVGKSHEDLEKDHILRIRWRAAFDFVSRTRLAKEIDHKWTDVHGKEKYYVTRIVPLITASNGVAGIITISTDVSDREKRAINLQVEGKNLKRADDRKNEYLATLAHELRGPLAPISSAVQLMKLSNKPEMVLKAREIIERQVSQMAGLIDDLMEIGRISIGKLNVSMAKISVDSLINNVVEATQPVFKAKNQNLKIVEIPPNLNLMGDQIRLTQLLTNLLVNASKYSAQNTEVRLEAIKVDKNIEFRVKDDGIGLTEDSIGEIFEMFSQVHATGKDARGGLGIGLALAQQVAILHDGIISVTSLGLNKGSTFIFTMPLFEGLVTEEIENQSRELNDKPMRILIVDDNQDGANALADMIGELGHTVTTAYDGSNAIILLENENFDLAFLDLGLPDKSGVEVALTISKKVLNDRIKLVALTGLSRQQDKFITKAAGFAEHLVKPIKFKDLIRLVGRVDSH